MPHVRTKQEIRETAQFSWRGIPTHDQVPTERLTLKLPEFDTYRRRVFSDGGSTTLEVQLSEVISELEMRIVLAERRREERGRAEEERRRQWQAARDAAVVTAREQHRARILDMQVDRWQRLHLIDAYVTEMQQRVRELPPGQDEAAQDWLNWVQAYRERIDALANDIGMPADPEFTAELLKPHMGGWSPYGP